MRISAFVVLIIVISSAILLPTQNTAAQDSGAWTMTLSSDVIYVGQELWVNVSGFQNRTFIITFYHTTNQNYSFQQIGTTNAIGNWSESYSLRQTAMSGHYTVSLTVNQTIQAMQDFEIVFDEYVYVISILDEVVNWQEREEREDESLYYQINVYKEYARTMGKLALIAICLNLFFVMFFSYVLADKIWKDIVMATTNKGGLLHRNLAGVEDDIIRFDNAEVNTKRKRLPRDFEFSQRDNYYSVKNKKGETIHVDELIRDRDKYEANKILHEIAESRGALDGFEDETIPKKKRPSILKDKEMAAGMGAPNPEIQVTTTDSKARKKHWWQAKKPKEEADAIESRAEETEPQETSKDAPKKEKGWEGARYEPIPISDSEIDIQTLTEDWQEKQRTEPTALDARYFKCNNESFCTHKKSWKYPCCSTSEECPHKKRVEFDMEPEYAPTKEQVIQSLTERDTESGQTERVNAEGVQTEKGVDE